MLAHGKLASPFLYPRPGGAKQHSAPAGKAKQVGGAGDRANSRNGSLAKRNGGAHTPVGSVASAPARTPRGHYTGESEAHLLTLQVQRTLNGALANMIKLANDMMNKADQSAEYKLAYQWAARAIAADVAKRCSNNEEVYPE